MKRFIGRIFHRIPITDHLGSVRMISDEGGRSIWEADYYAFGQQFATRSRESRFNYGFTGKEFDPESGLNYHGARFLDSKIGRFLQVDPLSVKYPAESPYHYCSNNPLVYIDPDGLENIYILDTFDQNDSKGAKYSKNSRKHINKAIEILQKKGMTVKVITSATLKDFKKAFSDNEAYMVISIGHGAYGNLQSSDGTTITSKNMPNHIGENLCSVILQHCNVAQQYGYDQDSKSYLTYYDDWKSAFGDNVLLSAPSNTTGVKGVQDFMENTPNKNRPGTNYYGPKTFTPHMLKTLYSYGVDKIKSSVNSKVSSIKSSIINCFEKK